VARYDPDPPVWTTAEASTHRADAGNPNWGVSGLHAEKTQSWGLISADIVRRAAGEVNWQSDDHRVTVALTEMSGIARIDGGPARSVRILPGLMAFCPAGVTVKNVFPAGRMIQIRQKRRTYDTIISEMVQGGSVRLERQSAVCDPLVLQIASTIAREIESGFLDRILVDALNTALAARIVQQFVDPAKIKLEPSNGLSRERLQRVYDYIEAHLDDRLSLAALAAVACLSPITSAGRSSRRSASDRSATSCSGGSIGQKP
jgi:hypothetical protein